MLKNFAFDLVKTYAAQVVLLTVVLTAGYISAVAQGPGTVCGTVKAQNDAAIPGASVTAINTASDSRRMTTTDQNGNYEFRDLNAGPYRITVEKNGFSSTGSNVAVISAEKATHNFSMNLGSLREDVTVTAARGLRATSEIPQTVTVVTDEDMITRRPVSIADSYDKAPSVLTTDSNPYRSRPQIRGLQSSRILVTVDGERLNNARFSADFVGVSPSLVDTTQIQTVEVVAGSSSSLYGSDAVGGTINIITKGAERSTAGTRVDLRADGDYGSNNNYRKGAFAAGVGGNKFAIRGNVAGFKFPSYHLGGQGIARSEVLTFGNFARQAGNAIGQNVVGSYAVYDFAGDGLVTNSQARGVLGGIDAQVFPTDRQTGRIRFQTNNYKDLGVGVSGTPTGVNQATTGDSEVQKFSGRYEVREIVGWFPRVSFGAYRQTYDRRLDEVRNNVVVGSSCTAVTGTTPPFATTCPQNTTLTGNVSQFVLATIAHTTTETLSKGFDAQFNFIPFKNAVYISGFNYSNEDSHDFFAQDTYNAAGTAIAAQLSDVRNVPDTTYRNLGWYNQFEYTPVKYFRFAGGFRFDDWKTQAKPTTGFPVGNVANIISSVLPRVQANPGGLNVSGASGILSLLTGSASLETQSKVWTYNVGGTVFIPGGFNPYIRYSTSFREPDLTAKFLVRNFFSSPSVISFVGLTNTALAPERGRDIDYGIKVARRQFRANIAGYRNEIRGATGTVTGSYCLSPAPTGSLAGACLFAPGPPPTLGHQALVFQTVNFSKVVIKGWEAEIEGDIRLGDAGSITPYFSLGYIKATNKNPDANRLAVVNNFYNSSAPLKLEGSATDVPFYSLPKYKYAFAPKFTSANGMWWAEYEVRGTNKVTRVDPGEISFAQATQYYYFAAYKGFQKQSIRGGFKIGETVPISVTLGIDNLANRTYFSLFQPTPSMGRTFTIGTTITWSKLIK